MRWIAILLGLVVAMPAVAQDYPSRPVKIVVSYAPGGSNDVVARVIAPELQKELGQSFMSVASTAPQIRAGKLRALAVTSARRSEALPDLPTLHELGIDGYDVGTWWGLLAPAGTPDAIVDKLNAAMRKAVVQREVKERFAPLGLDPRSDSPAAFAAFIKAEVARYAAIAKIAGIEPE